MQLVVNPKDCVDGETLEGNIGANLGLIKEWVDWCKPNLKTAYILSGGPSLDKRLSESNDLRKELNKQDSIVFCVKHALPVLKKHKIIPDFCVALDPRPLNEKSTHGEVRQNLYDQADSKTTFLIASMTEPSVTKYLQKQGYNVVGWHAAVRGVEKFPGIIKWALGGGTCSATRTISLAKTLGFSKAKIYGMDSGLHEAPEDKKAKDSEGKPKYLKTEVENKTYWTTGELVAQIQDMKKFLTENSADVEIEICGLKDGESIGAAVLNNTENKTIKPWSKAEISYRKYKA